MLKRAEAIILQTVLKQIDKPSFFGKDKIHKTFWGNRIEEYFPQNIIFSARHFYKGGVISFFVFIYNEIPVKKHYKKRISAFLKTVQV